MIVCSCNRITRRDIEATIERLLAEDRHAVLTPSLIYHRLGKRGKCGGCFAHVVEIEVAHGERVRNRLAAAAPAAAVGKLDAPRRPGPVAAPPKRAS